MGYIITFDIGTTAVKGTVVNEAGQMLDSRSINIETIYDDNLKEQRPDDWYEAFCQISADFLRTCQPDTIIGLVMSGQMQDLIMVGKDDTPVYNAILYSDGRAVMQAEKISDEVGISYLTQVTGNHFDGSLPVSKLLWMKENEPDIFAKIHKILISSKDYIILKLTGQAVSDVTACATAGAMDIFRKVWDEKIVCAAGASPHIFPELKYSEECAGFITEQAARETGYRTGTPVYAGVGDAGATTLASGINEVGEYNVNLGTSGWIAAISDGILEKTGVFNLAAMPKERYINVVPFLNAGNVHNWVSSLFDQQQKEASYARMEKEMDETLPGSKGVLFLPYIAGERFPVMDPNIKGTWLGLTPETGKPEMMRASLEGVAYSIRQGLETLHKQASKISLIGGGAKSKVWCQILADVLNHEVLVYKNAEALPSVAIAAAVLLGEGKINSYHEFTKMLSSPGRCDIYKPNQDNAAIYDQQYNRYVRIYPAVKSLYAVEES